MTIVMVLPTMKSTGEFKICNQGEEIDYDTIFPP